MVVVKKSDERLVERASERALEDLYEKSFPAFARFAAKMNTSFEDAKDVFHDALVIYYEKSQDAVDIRISAEAYVVGIAKHLLIRKYRLDRSSISLSQLELTLSVPIDYYPAVDEIKLLKFLERSGRRCMELLQKFYYEKTSLKDIAASLGYSTAHSATAQKFKCIGKIRDAIKSKALDYEDFVL